MMDGNKVQISVGGGTLECTLRISQRAKRMQLKVTSWGKVEVVVPRYVAISRVAPFVQRHRHWLERAVAKVRAMHDEQPALASLWPETIHLAAFAEDWRVSYEKDLRASVRSKMEADGRRLLRVTTAGDAATPAALRKWLHDYARQRLLPWLQAVSDECRLPYAGVTVRAQKTRWGSCTARGHISLNRHLLFLPPHLVRYLFIHELCHTVHLNHSPRYWSLVRSHEPDYAQREAELRHAARHVPLWACPQ